jgi:hypothetical protein
MGARRRVARGESPSKQKCIEKRAAVEEAAGTFSAVAETWYTAKAPHRSTSWREAIRRWLDKELYPAFGTTPLADITPADVLAAMKAMETLLVGPVGTDKSGRGACIVLPSGGGSPWRGDTGRGRKTGPAGERAPQGGATD